MANKTNDDICRIARNPEQAPMTLWTIVHFWVGVLAQQVGCPGWFWFLLIVLFEIVENKYHMYSSMTTFVEKTGVWPPYYGDSLENSTMDVIWGMLGWTFGWILDFIILRRNTTTFWQFHLIE
jgi:hypothetical protein